MPSPAFHFAEIVIVSSAGLLTAWKREWRMVILFGCEATALLAMAVEKLAPETTPWVDNAGAALVLAGVLYYGASPGARVARRPSHPNPGFRPELSPKQGAGAPRQQRQARLDCAVRSPKYKSNPKTR
jgi:hypothetical protein